jgi:hypothetical protein
MMINNDRFYSAVHSYNFILYREIRNASEDAVNGSQKKMSTIVCADGD